MTLLKENAYEKVGQLVTRFDEQYTSYKNTDYNETLTRRDFIDPFFKALGWDIDNEQGYAESYREVIHEDKVMVSGVTKAPDYAFRLVGGKRLFFVEAKKPSVLIKNDFAPAFQVRRYGWSAKLPISIITDFEEFAVYDCTKKPFLTDKAATARIRYLTYTDYLKDFEFIWETFSKEQVLKGSFDKFVQSDTYKKGTATVDNDFLQSLDSWRTHLAASISWNNKHLNEDEINFAVQQTIDRIIFLRIAEDRSVEPYGNLKDCIKEGNLYQNLYKVFVKADEKYNSGLFDFNKDKISHNLEIDNKVIKTIINELYYPCPYAFAVLPVEILGTAYEQFLGKVIRITPSHHAKIEEKPEVRKAGGVYYTPQYIVEYIVKNTVGKLIEGKTPKEISTIKIVDPACGSGSFLLGAYQYLLDYHKSYCTGNGKTSKGIKGNTLTPEGNLTTAEKKRILINNIFGVDIDINAVEVTKLSLLLKCMEGETEASIATQMRLFHDRVLPTLENNIKSGNSLIDTDYYDNELDFGDEKKTKPFSWKKAFPETFKQGGFDVVIGNPPYVLVFNDEIKKYLETNYTVFQRNNDLYVAFIAKCLTLVKPKGIFSMITPNSFIRGDYFKSLRQLLNKYRINEIVDFGNKLIFNTANVFTCIFNIVNDKPSKSWTMKSDLDVINSSIKSDSEIYVYKDRLIQKLDALKKFDDYFLIKDVGYNYWTEGRGKQRGKSIGSRILYKGKKENPKDIPYLKGSNFNRYKIEEPTQYLRYNYEIYLNENDTFRFSPEILENKTKLIYRQTSSSLIGTIETNRYHNDKTVHVIIPKDGFDINLRFVLGLFNSKLLNYYYSKAVNEEGRAFAQVKIINVKKLPFILADKNTQSKIIELVQQLLKLNEEIQATQLQSRIEQLKTHIDHCEEKINEIVYRLYELTDEEIKVVAGKNEEYN